MPELPDVIVYIEALISHVIGRRLERLRLSSPFVLRSVDPPVEAITGRVVTGIRRIGKRIVIAFGGAGQSRGASADDDLFLVLHLMIAGRLRWRALDAKLGLGSKIILATFAFEHGTLFLTEASSRKRASIHLVRGESALATLDPGGLEPLEASLEAFREAITRENHTLKRTLTDPHVFSGIGNAYSDEILHAAHLSPLKLSKSLSEPEVERLYQATRTTLREWIERLRRESATRFPEKVTAFHEAMAVHGRFRKPCPVCGSPIQRIVRAEHECNYCATCQTGGRLLADRSLSRLLKEDWPKWLEK